MEKGRIVFLIVTTVFIGMGCGESQQSKQEIKVNPLLERHRREPLGKQQQTLKWRGIRHAMVACRKRREIRKVLTKRFGKIPLAVSEKIRYCDKLKKLEDVKKQAESIQSIYELDI